MYIYEILSYMYTYEISYIYTYEKNAAYHCILLHISRHMKRKLSYVYIYEIHISIHMQ